jgi:hypothetical protein
MGINGMPHDPTHRPCHTRNNDTNKGLFYTVMPDASRMVGTPIYGERRGRTGLFRFEESKGYHAPTGAKLIGPNKLIDCHKKQKQKHTKAKASNQE